jgi:flagellum-specific peptidoglycan hydrolase FlgJ
MKAIAILLTFFSLSTFAQEIPCTLVELTTENVKEEIKKAKIKHPDIVLRQAILETGYFKSYNATYRNNLFGFWNSRRKRYLEFACWIDSIRYYRAWQDKHYKGGNYYEFLTKIGYAEDPDYIWKLKNIDV